MKAIRRFTVRVTLPEPLAALHGLMLNLRWSWHRPAADLFASIDPAAWAASGGDPIAMLSALPSARIAALAADEDFLRRLGEAEQDLRRYMSEPRWYASQASAPGRDRLLLARVRHHRRAAAVLRRPGHPGRRPPEDGQRPGRAADRGRPAVPARLLHPVAVGRRLAGRAVPVRRPERPAPGAAPRRRRRAGARQGGPDRGPRAGRADLGGPGRPGPAAAARLLRGGERGRPARGHRPAVRRRQRPPAAPGAAARHRRGARGAGVLRAARAPLARGLPHQRGPRRDSSAWSGSASTPSRGSASTRPSRSAGRARCSPRTPRSPRASTGSSAA